MKYLLLFLLLTSCYEDRPIDKSKTEEGSVPAGIRKFEDGNINCYTYYQNAISCVRRY